MLHGALINSTDKPQHAAGCHCPVAGMISRAPVLELLQMHGALVVGIGEFEVVLSRCNLYDYMHEILQYILFTYLH